MIHLPAIIHQAKTTTSIQIIVRAAAVPYLSHQESHQQHQPITKITLPSNQNIHSAASFVVTRTSLSTYHAGPSFFHSRRKQQHPSLRPARRRESHWQRIGIARSRIVVDVVACGASLSLADSFCGIMPRKPLAGTIKHGPFTKMGCKICVCGRLEENERMMTMIMTMATAVIFKLVQKRKRNG